MSNLMHRLTRNHKRVQHPDVPSVFVDFCTPKKFLSKEPPTIAIVTPGPRVALIIAPDYEEIAEALFKQTHTEEQVHLFIYALVEVTNRG